MHLSLQAQKIPLNGKEKAFYVFKLCLNAFEQNCTACMYEGVLKGVI